MGSGGGPGMRKRQQWLPDGVGQKTASLRHVFLGGSENDHGSMNLATKTAPVAFTRPSKPRSFHFADEVARFLDEFANAPAPLNGFPGISPVLQRVLITAWRTGTRCSGKRRCRNDRHGMPDRVLAPQRGLDSIGPVLRR